MDGCEKFVLKFPLKVLVSFLNSFSIVQQLSTMTETVVFERYLAWRWTSHEPSLGPCPTGPGSIARMRVVVMGQGDSKRILDAYRLLPPEDAEVLDKELACTGCSSQFYTHDSGGERYGPGILVYYAPAFMQKAGATDPLGTLIALAEVFRQARVLFPGTQSRSGEVVIVRIDALKELQVNAIQVQPNPGDVWALQRTSHCDAQVLRVNLMEPSNAIDWSTCRVLFASPPAVRHNPGRRNSGVGMARPIKREDSPPARRKSDESRVCGSMSARDVLAKRTTAHEAPAILTEEEDGLGDSPKAAAEAPAQFFRRSHDDLNEPRTSEKSESSQDSNGRPRKRNSYSSKYQTWGGNRSQSSRALNTNSRPPIDLGQRLSTERKRAESPDL
eukprot:gnl/TRDRNA2_/TRDRNA2_143693_c2_seq1.p1 gnl/TRDRNA2_/TRDRNA2_143693_c2~~gnl/TRDRNA2_/TRDRNA2_143693_c2_seq1.p1  ORF type:complete len:434 (+),score=54.99 gnl/TRDRNA2_/TRDRNA2_143693_c2_seq1:143-1303(+)